MRIAIYTGSIPSTTFIDNLIMELNQTENLIMVFGNRVGPDNYPDGIKVIPLPTTRLSSLLSILLNLPYSMTFNSARLRILWKEVVAKEKGWKVKLIQLARCLPVINSRPDVFHVQWAHSIKDWMWLRTLGIRVVCSLRGGQINYSPICDPAIADRYRLLFPSIDRFHAVSEAIKKEAGKYGAIQEKVDVIHSGVDLDKVEKLRAIDTNSRKDSVVRILSVGRAHWKKGYKYAIDACKLLKGRGLEFRYSIVAGGDLQEYRHQIFDLDLGDCVKLKTSLPQDDVIRLMSEADILILPSIEEGIANVVLEAMSAGCIVVSTDCGGMGEVITNGENGFLVKRHSSQALSDAVLDIVSLEEKASEQIKDNAFHTIQERFSNGNLRQNFEQFYTSTV